MTEVLFYHLEQQPLERVLPVLLEKTLERGWKAAVQIGNPDRVTPLDTALWTFRDDSFVPHGAEDEPNGERQPVVLCESDGNPNGATVRFIVEGADPGDVSGYERVVFMFNGHDQTAVQQARGHWKMIKGAGLDATYWQQSSEGRWEKKA